MTNEIEFENARHPTVNEAKTYSETSIPYPRIMVNPQGIVILATSKDGILTTGISIGKTKECTSTEPIGLKVSDWEVSGELSDYNEPIEIVIRNKTK